MEVCTPVPAVPFEAAMPTAISVARNLLRKTWRSLHPRAWVQRLEGLPTSLGSMSFLQRDSRIPAVVIASAEGHIVPPEILLCRADEVHVHPLKRPLSPPCCLVDLRCTLSSHLHLHTNLATRICRKMCSRMFSREHAPVILARSHVPFVIEDRTSTNVHALRSRFPCFPRISSVRLGLRSRRLGRDLLLFLRFLWNHRCRCIRRWFRRSSPWFDNKFTCFCRHGHLFSRLVLCQNPWKTLA